MAVIHEREGKAALLLKGEEFARVRYWLVVDYDGNLASGSGTLDGDYSDLAKAFQSPNDVRLQFEDGSDVKIIINRLGDVCTFITSGVIPGVDVTGL